MPSQEQFAEAKKVRQKITFILSTRELTTPELSTIIYPKAEHSNLDVDYARLFRIIKKMEEAGEVTKSGLRGPWRLRAKPPVADLPENPQKRVYTKRDKPSTNGDGNGVLRAYLVRDIRAKLDELEALG